VSTACDRTRFSIADPISVPDGCDRSSSIACVSRLQPQSLVSSFAVAPACNKQAACAAARHLLDVIGAAEQPQAADGGAAVPGRHPSRRRGVLIVWQGTAVTRPTPRSPCMCCATACVCSTLPVEICTLWAPGAAQGGLVGHPVIQHKRKQQPAGRRWAGPAGGDGTACCSATSSRQRGWCS